MGGRGKSDESSLLSRKNEIEKLENQIRKEIAAYNEEIKKAATFEKSFAEIDEKSLLAYKDAAFAKDIDALADDIIAQADVSERLLAANG